MKIILIMKIQILLVALLSAVLSNAQSLTFSYDASGNQIQRKYINTSKNEVNSTSIFDKIEVFPNPTQDILTVKWSEELIGKVKKVNISSLQAEILFEQTIHDAQKKLNLNISNYRSGYYILHLLLIDNTIIDFKIIKK